MNASSSCGDEALMQQALALAKRGEGRVEPNPMVGCVLAIGDQIVGEGWHQQFGGPHAEVEAINAAMASLQQLGDAAQVAKTLAKATAYVTLEPCCHVGKTPPCTNLLIDSQIKRVVVAHRDPFPKVAGGGIQQLRDAGIAVDIGCCQRQASQLLAPYLMRVEHNRPWVIAKWAMTLDGRIASRERDSKWISNPSSRRLVHQIRARVDGVIVGRQTVVADDPQLTARPPGARTATRIVFDSFARTPLNSQLVMSCEQVPVLIFVDAQAPRTNVAELETAGVDVVSIPNLKTPAGINQAMTVLGEREMTNVLLEGGGQLLGAFHDAQLIDEWQVFVATKLIGGQDALSPMLGEGLLAMKQATDLEQVSIEIVDGDIHVRGMTKRSLSS